MKFLKAAIGVALCAVTFYFFNFAQNIAGFPLPPLGKFLNPFMGFWQNNGRLDALPEQLTLAGLQDEVSVVWDDRRVPHIFAQNDHDLYFAQGYVTARDRLWQMEFQTQFTAGRLSEILGGQALASDKNQRRLGLGFAAENAIKAMSKNAENMAVINAYADGVNAFIATLDAQSLPLEYKLLDYEPELWTPLKSALLLKMMSWTLTGRSSDRTMTRTRKALGDSLLRKLYPEYPPFQEPIIPPQTQWRFTPEKIPAAAPQFDAAAPSNFELEQPDKWYGSNNWAISGAKSANGYPILSNDPHLGLSLPSIWYEMQLNAPGVNVYGVTLPGSPAVIIGFNESAAWGVTNAGSDVLDWYQIKFKDASRTEYFYDGDWRPTKMRIEEIKIRGGETVLDTVFYTHHGPVVAFENAGNVSANSQVAPGAAMRWAPHEPSNELNAFLKLNRAQDYDDYLSALKDYDYPAQNFVYADVHNNIAIWHNGKFPLRWPGQGKFILDGSNPEHDWQGWVPKEHNPHVKNPERGFVSSANQNPTDPNYPYYLGSSWASFTRGARINERLEALQGAAPRDMMALQLDNANLAARTILPRLIEIIPEDSLNQNEKAMMKSLKAWNYENNAFWDAPTIYEEWADFLYELIWDDEMERENGNLRWPRSDVTFDLILNQSDSPFFDNKKTDEKETLPSLALLAFRQAAEKLEKRFGALGKDWAWGKARGTDIRHIARLPGLGRDRLFTNGNGGIVNATGRFFGPSWRMVVELGPEVKGWGVYPGGQSGNPGSYFYDDMVDDWVEGKTFSLLFLKSPDENNESIEHKMMMRRQ